MNTPVISSRNWTRILGLARGAPGIGELDPQDPAFALYAPIAAPPSGRLIVGQVGQSLDGRVATMSGDCKDISGPEGLKHLHRCRALVDAVVVGAGTILADDPRLTVRLVAGGNPARVVIDPNGRVPNDARIFEDDGARRIVIQLAASPRPAGVETVVLPGEGGVIAAGAIVAALDALCLHRLLIEGGAVTLGRFIAAGLLDRLHVTIAPKIIGSGPAGLSLPPIDLLSQALVPKMRLFDLATDFVFDCAMRPAEAAALAAE